MMTGMLGKVGCLARKAGCLARSIDEDRQCMYVCVLNS
jgi:hypothetical protein